MNAPERNPGPADGVDVVPPGGLLPATIRIALHASGISVWEWDITTDRLDGEEHCVLWLGYDESHAKVTQAGWDTLVHPDDLIAQRALTDEHLAGRTPLYEHEYRVRAADGAWRWMSERGRVVEWSAEGRPLRMVGTISDIDARRRAEAGAVEIAERLRKIARHVPGMVFQFERRPDGASRFPYVSDSCIDLLGLAPEVLMRDATAFTFMVPDPDRGRVLRSINDSWRELKPWRCTYPLQGPGLHGRGGTQRWVTGHATPQLEPGGVVLWHGYIEDTTDTHELEQSRRAAAAAEAASKAKTAFLSRMSHELRTPLNAVLGFAQLLELDGEDALTPMQARRVGLIREAGVHLLQMIGELLDLTRIESGQMALAIADVPLAPLVDECVAMLGVEAAGAGVTVESSVRAGDALVVVADPTRLRQALINLLGNAIKYNRAGGRVQIRARREADGMVVIEVGDNGLGIAAEDLPNLFEPFNRLAQRAGPIEGTGIGLAVTRGLVEHMGGRIEVESRAGAGSTFRVVLADAVSRPEKL